MKINDVRTHIVEFKLDRPLGSSYGFFETRRALLIEVQTDAGYVGWGEAHGLPEACSSVISAALRPFLLGRDPTEVNVLWHEMYGRTRHFGQKGVVVAAISGVDIALWDILGKELGQPIHKLLGGSFRSEVETYATGLFYSPGETLDELQRRAVLTIRQGSFGSLKMKIGGLPWREDIRRVAAVREAIGTDTLLMVDANRAFNASAAIAIGRELAPLDVYWFEEPVPPEDLPGYCAVKAGVPMLIAGGECEFTRHGFSRLFEARALDIVQPETCAAGGLTECRRIADLACMAGIFYVPHMHGTAIALAASLHLAAAVPPVSAPTGPHPPLLELDTSPNPMRDELLDEPFRVADGRLPLPTCPGLGIQINRAVLERFSVD